MFCSSFLQFIFLLSLNLLGVCRMGLRHTESRASSFPLLALSSLPTYGPSHVGSPTKAQRGTLKVKGSTSDDDLATVANVCLLAVVHCGVVRLFKVITAGGSQGE